MEKLKIYKTFHAYQSYLDDFYLRFPEMKYAAFQKQKEALIYDGAPWIFSWSAMNYDDDIHIFETVHNGEYIQKAWSKEFSTHPDWHINIVLEQINNYQPDVCVLYPPHVFTPDVIEHIKTHLKHQAMFIGYDGMDRKDAKLYSSFDLVLTCSDYISRYYSSKNINTYTLPFSFDETILNRLNGNSRSLYNVGFTGSIFSEVHDDRYDLLRKISSRIRVDIRTDFMKELNLGLFSKFQLKRLLKKRDLKTYLEQWRIDKLNRGALYGLEMYQFLKDSKISLNMHGDKIGFAANVRMFEVTGVGSCLLTDWKENIEDIFEPEVEVVTYRSAAEAIDKAKFLLRNEKKRSQIAHKGQQRTLNHYTHNKTFPKLFKFLKKQIGVK